MKMRFDSTLCLCQNFCVGSILWQLIMFSLLSHYSLHFVLFSSHSKKVNTITKKNKCALWNPYQTRAKTKIMSEIEEVQEQMKANMDAMKDQMTSKMEAMLSVRRMMEDNTVTVATTSVTAEADPTHPSDINQTSCPAPDMVGQGGEVLGSTGGPHMVQNKNSYPPYGLPPNYTPPNAVHVPSENANYFVPVEGQQPQLGHAPVTQPMGEARE